VHRHDFTFCDFEADGDTAPDPFFNANTPEELAEAERYLAGTSA
jgi:molybdopterin-guanine dinucleotide biosynthesis protein A